MPEITGTVHPRFAAVEEAFARNFELYDEVGASLCVTLDGEVVVDLAGGTVTAEPDAAPFGPDTLVVVFSCTKGLCALAFHRLVDRGLIDLDAPVATYWPEFATAGKESATVRMLLNHTVGVPAWRDPVPRDELYDFDAMAARCAAEPAFWEPGTRQGYHMISFGWLIGEVMRRVTGDSLGAILHREVAAPAGADIFLGLPEAEEVRVAPVIHFVPDPANPSAMTRKIRDDRNSIPALALLNPGFNPNRREAHAAEIGGAGALGSGRGLAHAYRPFATGTAVGADTLARMGRVSAATMRDATLGIGTSFGLGFMTTIDNRGRAADEDRDSVILSPTAFGHVGAGGSIGFADPAERLSVGYAMNRHGNGILLNERGQALVDAIYRSLGYRSDDSGAWVR